MDIFSVVSEAGNSCRQCTTILIAISILVGHVPLRVKDSAKSKNKAKVILDDLAQYWNP